MDPAAFALSGPTPNTFPLPVGQRIFEASLPNCALITDSLCLACLLIGDRVENIWIDAPAGCALAPGGTHGNVTFSLSIRVISGSARMIAPVTREYAVYR